jgi:hypothetical protein
VTAGISVVAEVTSFDAAGFLDHQGPTWSRHPAAVLRIDEPADLGGSTVILVLDAPLEGADLLTEPGARVRLLLDADAAGMDTIFSGALLDGIVHDLQDGGTP